MTPEQKDFLIILLQALVLIALCARQAWIWYALSKHGVHATAIVDSTARGKAGWLRVQYHFDLALPEKELFSGRDAGLKWYLGEIAPGMPIGIRYYKNNPKLSRIDHNGFQNWGLRVWHGPTRP